MASSTFRTPPSFGPRSAWMALPLALALALIGCTAEPALKVEDKNPLSFAKGPVVGEKEVPVETAIVCNSSVVECDGLAKIRTCAVDGSAWQPTACAEGQACEDAACRAILCKPGALSCDGNALRTCTARGVSFGAATACAVGSTCIAGACAPHTCKQGALQCIGNAVGTCRPDGQGWSTVACASDQSCAVDPGDSKVFLCREQICLAGTIACQDGHAVQCDDKGLSTTAIADCSEPAENGSAQTCLGGACVPLVCQPGATTCSGSKIATCAGTGMTWTPAACPSGYTCSATGEAVEGKFTASGAACQEVVCKPGETFCAGHDVAHCNGNGTAFDIEKSCAVKQVCKQGACAAATVLCGDGICDGDEDSTCSKDCKPVTIIAPDFDKVPVGVPLGLPRAPRLLTKDLTQPGQTAKALQLFGNRLLVVDTDNGALVVLDRATLAVLSTIPIGSRPELAVVGPDGTVWISVRDAGEVAKVPAALALAQVLPTAKDAPKVAKFKVGFEPIGMALTLDAKVLFVTLAGEDVLVSFDAVTGVEFARAKTLVRPRSVTLSPAGKAVVLHGDNAIAVIAVGPMLKLNPLNTDLGPAQVTQLRTANPVPACQGLTTVKVRTANRAVSATIEPESGDVLISHVLVASGSAKEVLAGAGIKPADKPQQFVQKCSGGYGSTCSMVPVPPPPGEPACVGPMVRPYELAVTRVGTASGKMTSLQADLAVLDVTSGRNFLSRFDQPAEILHHPTLTLAFVVARGTNNVLVIHTAPQDPMRWPLADIKVGEGPKAMTIAPDGQKAWVLNGNGFTVSEIDLAPLTAFTNAALEIQTDIEQLAKVSPLYLKATKAAAYGKDPLSAEVALGRKVFFLASNSRLSVAGRFACATCHLDGLEDKQVWFIAEGPRQTPALAGRLAGTAPYNWMGSKFTLHDNIVSTTSRMGGSGLVTTELDGLEQFLLTGLKEPPNPHLKPTGLTPQQEAGKKLYFDATVGCSGCHTAKADVAGAQPLTDGAQHDVGTATPVEQTVADLFAGKAVKIVYNTPSLRGLYYTAPYLHDGSAATLQSALQKTANTMGKTSHLSSAQVDDLVAYLLTL